jgi:hypothetical protein
MRWSFGQAYRKIWRIHWLFKFPELHVLPEQIADDRPPLNGPAPAQMFRYVIVVSFAVTRGIDVFASIGPPWQQSETSQTARLEG